jgi:succinate-acetate transporter protein
MLSRVRAMPGGIRLFLVYGMLILAGIAIVLPAVVERAVGAVPVTFDGLVVMCLLAYTIFTLTLVLQRKQAGRGLALGLTSLALPLIPLLLLAGAIIQAGVVTAVAVLLFRGLLRDEVRAYLDEP